MDTKKEGRMTKQRHSLKQIISKFRKAEVQFNQGRNMGEVCRTLVIPVPDKTRLWGAFQ